MARLGIEPRLPEYMPGALLGWPCLRQIAHPTEDANVQFYHLDKDEDHDIGV